MKSVNASLQIYYRNYSLSPKHNCFRKLVWVIAWRHLLPKHLVSLRGRRWIKLRRKSESKHPLAIQGTEGMVVSYAKCCHPIPGDSIIGIMTAGKGLVIHYVKCRNTRREKHSRDKWIHVNWASNPGDEFTAEISIKTANERGVLAVVAAKISEQDSNIENIVFGENFGATTTITVLLTVKDRDHLARIYACYTQDTKNI